MLAPARDWLARRGDDLSPAERGYIDASVALQRRAEEEREAARQAEIRHQQELAEAAGKLAEARQTEILQRRPLRSQGSAERHTRSIHWQG
jgi:fido (protein-threonine AMPylation protein)